MEKCSLTVIKTLANNNWTKSLKSIITNSFYPDITRGINERAGKRSDVERIENSFDVSIISSSLGGIPVFGIP